MSRKERRKLAKLAAKGEAQGETGGQAAASLERLFGEQVAHFDAGRLKEAEAGLAELQRRQPDMPEVLHLLALIELQTDRAEAAAGHLEKALARVPGSADLNNLLGVALKELERPDDAIAAYGRAIDINPGHVEAHVNLGAALHDLCRLKEAQESFRRALDIDPGYAAAHENLGITLLLDGQFKDGWAEYAWRSGQNVYLSGDRVLDRPFWDGSDLDGKTLFLFAGQGLGDAIQFFRYLPMVSNKGGDVILQCPASLIKLFEAAPAADGIQLVTEIGNAPFDLQAPLHGLPGLFATTLDTIPANVPTLRPPGNTPPALVLESSGGLKVGLVWAGDPKHKNDANRSLGFERFQPLLDIKGVDFYSLQVGERGGDIRNNQALGGLEGKITDLGKSLSDFADTAAAVGQLDLVITVDTSVAHLAGALAKPVWTLLPWVPDWRWLLDRDDSPWYPTMRLFRQPAAGDWDAVFKDLGAALGQLAEGNP